MKYIDLNSDLGESFGRYTVGNDDEIIRLVSSVNVACGFHASDPSVMEKTVMLAKKRGVSIGAHPGFNDLQGFGRRKMSLSSEEIYALIIYQVGALVGFCKAHSVRMTHVKPHGALYNMAVNDYKTANAIVRAIKACAPESGILAPYGSKMIECAKEYDLKYACEFFADRAYEDDGSLVSRTKAGSMIENAELVAERVLTMLNTGTVLSTNDKTIKMKCDSVCVHGDNKKAIDCVNKIRSFLFDKNIMIKSCW